MTGVQTCALPISRREPYWHKLQKGGYVGYRCTKSGGSWIGRWRSDDGNQQYDSYGTLSDITPGEQFDEAQRLAREWFKSLGAAPITGYTVKTAIDDYVKSLEIKKSPKAGKDVRQRLDKHVPSSLGDIKLTKVTMKDLTQWQDSLVRLSGNEDDTRKSKDGANRLLNMLKAALNLAYKNDIVGSDRAWRRVSAFEDVGEARKIILTDKQIARLYEAIDGGFHNIIKSALLTGARYGELVAARVTDFDAGHGSIMLAGKTGERICYLSDTAIAHFKQLSKNKLPSAFIHTKDDGTTWGKSHQHRPTQAAVKAARLPQGTTFYALRHTHISRALLAGVNTQVVAENCGTSVRMIEKHYGKFLKSDRRAMFNKVMLT